ncbi:hypothetical protein F3Y22_tig00002840pilonHSYRG01484 [Hibiscus syriacus]|uniref:Reverse transcriptase domain-containing protein n=1 Tax=Hibiscus syriacus TaxID=106335 RepID=A0A6A3CSF4_HIBSY|nr:hypothetical protein F3Y22_tig00002840pilonHSYRG01484 [Hibiscus syriacus]
MEPPLDMPETRWCRHLKEPACVVGEHRQLDLPDGVDVLLVLAALGDTCTVGCFLISSKLSSVTFSCLPFSTIALEVPRVMTGWIRECVTTPKFFISLNGGSVGFFNGTKGVRQGDPLSPYLFVIVINVLSRLLDRAAGHGVFRFHPKCHRISLTNLYFADDLLVFTKGTLDSIVGIWEILKLFCSFSGLCINPSTSELFSSGVSEAALSEILDITGIVRGKLPVRGERLGPFLMLVDSNLFNLWWGNKPAKEARVKWSVISSPKSEGGLGLKSIKVWNRACFLVLIRKILLKEGSVWVAWLYAYIIKDDSFWDIACGQNSSWTWRAVLQLRAKAASNGLPTRSRLISFGLTADGVCGLCMKENENRDHLFFKCEVSRLVWSSVSACCGENKIVLGWSDELSWACRRLKGKSLKAWVLKLAWSCCIDVIWKARNYKVFRGNLCTVVGMVDQVKEMMKFKLWGKRMYSGDTFYRDSCIAWG